eukprot:scaffold10199_cov146-Cylindrotheca_fusiformis.AAC.19
MIYCRRLIVSTKANYNKSEQCTYCSWPWQQPDTILVTSQWIVLSRFPLDWFVQFTYNGYVAALQKGTYGSDVCPTLSDVPIVIYPTNATRLTGHSPQPL